MDTKNEEQLTFESYKEQINIWYKAHNIIREKAELYYDFISSLLILIDETYLGPDALRTEEDIFNHFTWCFNKVTSNFEKERIYFTNKSNHYEYLWRFFYKAYYTSDDKNVNNLSEYLKILFTFNKIKSPTELESFISIYKILDENLKKIN